MKLLSICRTWACLSFALPGHECCQHCEQALFDRAATAETIMYILMKPGTGFMPLSKIMFLLFVSDRTMLSRYGYTITGARWYKVTDGFWSPQIQDLIDSMEKTGQIRASART